MADSAALAASAYGNATERNDAQKKALLDAIAQQGTAGREAYQKSGQAINKDRQAAIQATMGQGAGGQNLLAGQSQEELGFLPGGRADALSALAGSNRSAQAQFQADRSTQAAGVNEYFGRLNSAIPIEQSRTQGAIEQIIKQQEDAQAEREFQKQMQQLQLQQAQTQLQQTRESGRGGGGGNLSVSDQLKIMDRDRSDAQGQFVGDFSASWGPKTSSALTGILANNKDVNGAMQALSQMAADSKNFTKPIYARDSKGHLITDSKGHARIEFDFTNVSPELLATAIQSYYNGGRAPDRNDWKEMNGGDRNVIVGDAR